MKCLNRFLFLLCCLLNCLHFNTINAQGEESSLLFIYDASGSMWGKMGNETKKEAASKILTQTIDNLEEDQKIGFMAYGHRSKSDCEDVELMANLSNTDKTKLKSDIKTISPLGKTPLAHSAKIAINTIKEAGTKTTIILVTDGIESCGGDLCEVIKLAREEGIEFKLHIIGFGLKDDETMALKCAAKEGEGNYYDAKDANQLAEVLDDAVHQKMEDPIPNHTFYATKNGVPVDAWIRITDQKSGEKLKARRTYKDTASLYLPEGTYSLTVNPLEGTDIASKTLELVKTSSGPSHTFVSFDGGKIEVFVTNNDEGWDATVKVIDRQTQKTVATTRTYKRKKAIEVNSGNYDIEINPLKLKGATLQQKVENINVEANKTNPVEYNYQSGELKIGVSLESGELVDATVNVMQKGKTKIIAANRTYTSASSNPKSIIIQPGTYDVKVKIVGKHKGTTKTETLVVTPGQTTTKLFQIN